MNRRILTAGAATIASVGLLLVAQPPALAQDGDAAQTWVADTVHSNAIFRIRHAGVTNFHGMFTDVRGAFTLDNDDASASSFEFTIGLDSVNTGAEGRDDHLRSPDFFNTRQFPEATFKSTSVQSAGANMYSVTGDLSLHGVTKSITAMVEHTGDGTFRNKPVRAFEATFVIKRSDFGMTTYLASDGGDSGALGNSVKVTVGVEANPA